MRNGNGKKPRSLLSANGDVRGGERKDSMLPISRPLVGEEEKRAILEVLESGHLAQGKRVEEFEDLFASAYGSRYAIATSSGTTSLHAALLAHGIGEGDEVITTPFSFVATANAVLYTGAKPVFGDIEADSFNIDPDRIEEKITPRTRAIVIVHLFGNPCAMDRIQALCKRYDLALIEDACQAHSATANGRPAGTFGTGCFSFYATKNMTTGEGGMILTSDPEIARRARMIRNHGMEDPYRHQILGYNFRMTDLQAAIGIVQFGKLERWTEQRIANATYLRKMLKGVCLPVIPELHRHVFHQFTIRVGEGRDAFLAELHRLGVGAKVYYPLPIHLQPVYVELGYRDSLPVAELASDQVVSLPVHPGLSGDDLDRIVTAVHKALDAGTAGIAGPAAEAPRYLRTAIRLDNVNGRRVAADRQVSGRGRGR